MIDMQPMDILLAEDDPAQAALLTDALTVQQRPMRVHLVPDGLEAVAFLRQTGAHTAAPRPHLVLLDLKMPRMTGLEVLAEMKTDPVLKLVPMLILSTSDEPADIQQAYTLGANGYITKPRSFAEVMEMAHAIQWFWAKTATLPAVDGRLSA